MDALELERKNLIATINKAEIYLRTLVTKGESQYAAAINEREAIVFTKGFLWIENTRLQPYGSGATRLELANEATDAHRIAAAPGIVEIIKTLEATKQVIVEAFIAARKQIEDALENKGAVDPFKSFGEALAKSNDGDL